MYGLALGLGFRPCEEDALQALLQVRRKVTLRFSSEDCVKEKYICLLKNMIPKLISLNLLENVWRMRRTHFCGCCAGTHNPAHQLDTGIFS